MALPGTLLRSLAGIVGEPHVLTGDATAGFAVDWTGRFRGQTPAVVRPRDTAEVAAVLALCTDAGLPVVPQGGNTGLVGGGVPLHGEVVLSLTRLNRLGPVDQEAAQVTAGAGVTLRQVADADPGLDLPILIASRDSATVGGAVATNAGGVRVLRFGPMRAQLRGIEAVLADGTVVSHLAGLVKDNTGYDYPSLLAGSEGTLAVITAARLRLVPRLRDTVTALAGAGGLDELHALACQAVREVPGLVSAEFFTRVGLDILVAHAGLAPPLPGPPAAAYLLLEASGPGSFGDLAGVIGDREAAVAESAADRARLWAYRERHPEAAGFLGVPVKLDVSVPAAQWVRLASSATAVVADVDPGAVVITFGHVADGNVHVNIVPAAPADGRHEEAVFRFVASLGGSISAEHGIGALKARWLPLARTEAERALFARIRSALDPAATLNPNVLPRGPVTLRVATRVRCVSGEPLTIVSLNTRGIPLTGSQLAERYAAIGAGFEAGDADVVCCQEVFTYWHLRLLVRRMHSFRRVSYRPGPFGPAGGLVTLSRRPVSGTAFRRFGRPPRAPGVPRASWVQARLKGALVTRLARPELRVINTHPVANHDGDWSEANRFYPLHRAEFAVLARVVNEAGPRAVVCGDFNVARESPLFGEFMAATGLADAFEGACPPTFRAEYLPAGATPHCIDFILTAGEVKAESAALVFAGKEPLGYVSDHIGLRARLSVTPTG